MAGDENLRIGIREKDFDPSRAAPTRRGDLLGEVKLLEIDCTGDR